MVDTVRFDLNVLDTHVNRQQAGNSCLVFETVKIQLFLYLHA
jgi:hypothetical protein